MRALSFLSVLIVFSLLTFSPAQVDAQVKTFQEVTGHTVGERIVENYQVLEYLKHLDQYSDRVSIFTIGNTYNRKVQMGAIVTSPQNHARIEEIRLNGLKLDDPRSISLSEAQQIMQNQPAILYLAGSIHGFELSGTEGIMMLLEHFTTSNDPETLEQLNNTVMIIDPTINADGRDAFAQFNHQHVGRVPSSDPVEWANDFVSWDGLRYRTSHYYFDLNRDWFAHTHNETRNRAAIFRQWRPQAGVDAHEMGPDREFYVDPPTDPVSPHFPPYASKWFELYGNAHAEAFDREYVEYTKGEIFNFFYPAYFTSFMTYQGAVGMLYEQGSSRGLALQRSDGTTRTLRDAAFQQYTAFRAMVKLSSDRRDELLADYYQANVESIEAGKSGTTRYLIKAEGDPHLVTEAVNLMMRSGIEVQVLNSDLTLRNVNDREGKSVGNHTFSAGTYVIDTAQPRMRLIRNLLEPHIPIPEEFLAQARQRVDRGENPRFYDITSWSLPLLFNLQGFSSSDSRALSATMITEPLAKGAQPPAEKARYAYLINGNQAAALSAIPYLRERDIRVNVLYKPTRINGVDYESGTVIVRTDGNTDDVHTAVTRLSNHFNLAVTAVHSGQADAGFPALGSIEGTRITKPEIVLLGNHPVQGYSFGWAWHTLDQVYQIPHTVINTSTIGNIPIERFNVIILPEVTNAGTLRDQLGDAGIERLNRWVRDGGTLVSLGSGTEFVRNTLKLINLKSWYDEDDNSEESRVSLPGAFFKAEFDRENWLTSGYSYELPILINSNRVYQAPDGPATPSRNTPVTIATGDDSKIAGHAWQENLERTPGSVFLYEERVGRGRVIAFAEDVNFRGYWRGANRLFLNAVILGPSAP
jgi:hypothetical protein